LRFFRPNCERANRFWCCFKDGQRVSDCRIQCRVVHGEFSWAHSPGVKKEEILLREIVARENRRTPGVSAYVQRHDSYAAVCDLAELGLWAIVRPVADQVDPNGSSSQSAVVARRAVLGFTTADKWNNQESTMIITFGQLRFVSGIVLVCTLHAAAAPPQAFPDGKLPNDRRLGKLRTTDDSTFPMQSVASADAWPARRTAIRRRILVAAGLHPMPKRSPLNADVHGKVERDEYTIERVILESFPGHYVTGSLYRPKTPPAGGKLAAVLCPHGHWKLGRFDDRGAKVAADEIRSGAERFEAAARHVIQARCVQLARMGCAVFVYDMEGYADSVQLDHRAGPRSKAANQTGYLLHSPRAELQGYTPFGLQTWNSIRALDFISSLEYVDPDRIAATGGSSGGTQSMILGAIDHRIAASMPAVMVSSGGQGGCTCENAQFLRIGQGNVDIAAATAPRPLGLICANDWTKALKSDGHPQLKALYEMLGHPDHYEAHFHFEFGRDSGFRTRQMRDV